MNLTPPTLGSDAHVEPDDIHRYVAATLSPAETVRFEQHLLLCSACQRAVREGVAIRSGLRSNPDRARGSTLRWVPWTFAAAAAILALVVFTRDDAMRRLGRLETAPAFQSLAVRASTSEVDRLVDSAMAAYAARDYTRSQSLLADVAAQRPSPAVLFYLGASALLSNDARAAIDPLRRLTGDVRNQYTDGAHFLLAKAWLRLGAPDSAVSQLSKVAGGSPIAARARSLADSVVVARRRP